jgi:hypothetical protein
VNGEVASFLTPGSRVFASWGSRHAVSCPGAAGVHGWWFSGVPWPGIDTVRCCRWQDRTLLYVGINPDRPPASGRAASRQNLRKRIRQHYTRTAAASTLRRSLGCLLAGELGIGPQPAVSSRRRTNFAAGEQLRVGACPQSKTTSSRASIRRYARFAAVIAGLPQACVSG